MDQRTRPAPRLAPLPPEHTPELKEQFEAARKRMGFIPNSTLIMQRNPKMLRGFTQKSAAIWDPEGKVDNIKTLKNPAFSNLYFPHNPNIYLFSEEAD